MDLDNLGNNIKNNIFAKNNFQRVFICNRYDLGAINSIINILFVFFK